MAPEYDFSGAERGRYAGRFYIDPETPENTTVVLRRPVPEHRLQAGDVGRITGATPGPGFLVTFQFGMGDSAVEIPLAPGDLRLPQVHEVLHVRLTRPG
jgi:hypothetical protein